MFLLSGSKSIVCIYLLNARLTDAMHTGDDALVVVWNLQTGESIQVVSCAFNGAVSAIAWIKTEDTDELSFVFGCADGSLHIYQRVHSNV